MQSNQSCYNVRGGESMKSNVVREKTVQQLHFDEASISFAESDVYQSQNLLAKA